MKLEIGGDGLCDWKDKRAGYYAMGHAHTQTQNVKEVTSVRWQAFLLRVQREDIFWFCRVVVVIGSKKEQWAEDHIFKMIYFNHIPARWLGGFSEYLGYPLAEAKRCVRECIAEALFSQCDDSSQFIYLTN